MWSPIVRQHYETASPENSDLPAGVQFSRLRTIQSSVSDLKQFRPDAKGKHVTQLSFVFRIRDPADTELIRGFSYQCLQFDTTGRYLLGMKVYLENQVVKPSDRGDIGSY